MNAKAETVGVPAAPQPTSTNGLPSSIAADVERRYYAWSTLHPSEYVPLDTFCSIFVEGSRFAMRESAALASLKPSLDRFNALLEGREL